MENISILFQILVAVSVYFVWIFRYPNVLAEFKQFGYSDVFRNFVGASKMSISALLILGLFYTEITLYASLGMAFFMLSAQLTHLRVKNPFKQRIPSLLFLLMSLFIAAFNYGLIQLMKAITILIFFTGISFIAYGINSFVSKRMISEFKRWGLADKRKLIGVCQLISGLGLILGFQFTAVLISSSIFICLMMLVAISVRIRIRDNISDILPAIAYSILCLIILYDQLYSQ